jgi:hypothetical protein
MKNNPPTIPPELAREIQDAIANGRPLPPGVVAIQPGQRPPPGSIPTGVSVPLTGGGHPQSQLPPTKAQNNPIPDGEDGLKILRNFANCPIPGESAKLNQLLQISLKNPNGLDDGVIDTALARGLTAAMRANRYCTKNQKSRIVCMFAENEQLKILHQKIKEEQDTLDRLNREMTECVKRGNAVLNERWKRSVDTYGLNPDKYFYRIDEEKGMIEQVSLDCSICKGAEYVSQARKDVSASLMVPATKPLEVVPPENIITKEV